MRIARIIVGFPVLGLLVSTGWQTAACEFADYELRDDLKHLASLGASRIGLAMQQWDDQLHATVIRKAAAHVPPDVSRVSGTGSHLPQRLRKPSIRETATTAGNYLSPRPTSSTETAGVLYASANEDYTGRPEPLAILEFLKQGP